MIRLFLTYIYIAARGMVSFQRRRKTVSYERYRLSAAKEGAVQDVLSYGRFCPRPALIQIRPLAALSADQTGQPQSDQDDKAGGRVDPECLEL